MGDGVAEIGLIAVFPVLNGALLDGDRQFAKIARLFQRDLDLVRRQLRLVVLNFDKAEATTGVNIFYTRQLQYEASYLDYMMISIHCREIELECFHDSFLHQTTNNSPKSSSTTADF